MRSSRLARASYFEDGSWLWANSLCQWIILRLNQEGCKWVCEAILIQQRLLSYGHRGVADKVGVAISRARGGLSLGEVVISSVELLDPGEQPSLRGDEGGGS